MTELPSRRRRKACVEVSDIGSYERRYLSRKKWEGGDIDRNWKAASLWMGMLQEIAKNISTDCGTLFEEPTWVVIHDHLNDQFYAWVFPEGYSGLLVYKENWGMCVCVWERKRQERIWIHLTKGNAINKVKHREQNVDTPSLTLDHTTLYNVYMFSKIALLPVSLSLATLGVLILKITKRTEKDHRALPLGCTAIHPYDMKYLKPNSQK